MPLFLLLVGSFKMLNTMHLFDLLDAKSGVCYFLHAIISMFRTSKHISPY